MKLHLLASVCATYVHADARTVLPALSGTWDVFTKGHHVADVNVQGGPAGTIAEFDDGHGDGDQYQLSVKHGLLEMNGWVARTERNPKAILWHRDNEEVMWRRQAKKLRGNSQTLEQSKSGLSRTHLPGDDSESTSPFADLIAQSEAARKHADATLAKAKDAPTAAKATEPTEPKEAKAPKEAEEEAPVATSSFDPAAHTAEPPANASMVEAAQPKKVSKAPRKEPFVPHMLSQDVMERYLVPLKAAQSQEKNVTKKHGVHERKKTFPAAMHSLAALMTNTQRGIDATVFDDVIESVRQIIRDEAAATCTDIETTYSDNADAVGECSTLHTYATGEETGTSADYDSADSAYTTAVSEYDDAVSTETTECAERDTACGNRDAKGLDLYNEVAASQYCPETTPEEELVFDDTFVLADVDSWANTILTKHTAWDTAKIECTTEDQECADAETVTAEKETTKTEKCTSLQTAATDGLSAYDQCYNTATGAYDGFDSSTTLDSIKNSIEAVETLMCYIDVAMEGLSAESGDDRTKNTDAQTSCSMDETTEEYICDCSNGNGVAAPPRYTVAYNLAVNIATPPDRDPSWDPLGCPEAVPRGDDDDDAMAPGEDQRPPDMEGWKLAHVHSHHYKGEKKAVAVEAAHAEKPAEKKESKAPTLSKKHAIVRSVKSAEPKHNDETL